MARSLVRPRLGTFIQRSRGKSSEEKAIYHNVTGAGRSKVIRRFLGLTDSDVEHIRRQLDEALQGRIDRGTR